jgi:DNA relaxase NicK
LKTAQRKQKQMQLQIVREHFAVLKTVLDIHAGTSAIVKQVENYSSLIKAKFNFDINEITNSLFQNNHYSQDINNNFIRLHLEKICIN